MLGLVGGRRGWRENAFGCCKGLGSPTLYLSYVLTVDMAFVDVVTKAV